MNYKDTLKQILGHNKWETLEEGELLGLMVLAAYTASEHAESLRLALTRNPIYPEQLALQQMAEVELMTDNLSYGEYRRQRNDHAAFLWHYIGKHKLIDLWEDRERYRNSIASAGERYHRGVRRLDAKIRSMSVFSRLVEMPSIFEKMLSSPKEHWKHPALKAFRFYIERQLKLDSDAIGRKEMIAYKPITDEVDSYYKLYFDMYKWSIFYYESPGD